MIRDASQLLNTDHAGGSYPEPVLTPYTAQCGYTLRQRSSLQCQGLDGATLGSSSCCGGLGAEAMMPCKHELCQVEWGVPRVLVGCRPSYHPWRMSNGDVRAVAMRVRPRRAACQHHVIHHEQRSATMRSAAYARATWSSYMQGSKRRPPGSPRIASSWAQSWPECRTPCTPRGPRP